MTSQLWCHHHKNSSICPQLNSPQNVYFQIFIFWKLTQWHCFVTYLWNDPRTTDTVNWYNFCVINPFLHLSHVNWDPQGLLRIAGEIFSHSIFTLNSLSWLCSHYVHKLIDTTAVFAQSIHPFDGGRPVSPPRAPAFFPSCGHEFCIGCWPGYIWTGWVHGWWDRGLKSASSSLTGLYCVFSSLVMRRSSSSPSSPPIKVGSPTSITSCHNRYMYTKSFKAEESRPPVRVTSPLHNRIKQQSQQRSTMRQTINWVTRVQSPLTDSIQKTCGQNCSSAQRRPH